MPVSRDGGDREGPLRAREAAAAVERLAAYGATPAKAAKFAKVANSRRKTWGFALLNFSSSARKRLRRETAGIAT
jgi:hypothetical protein